MNTIETASRKEILKFKIACKSNELSDNQIEYLFLNFELGKENEIEELINILLQYRKNVYDKYNKAVLDMGAQITENLK